MRQLTEAEEKLLQQYDRQRLKHNTAQARYRDKQKQTNPNYKDEYNAYMRQYNADRSKMIRGIKEKLTEQPLIPDAEVLLEMSAAPKQGRGRRCKADMDIVPSYLLRQQEGKKLKSGSLSDYLKKANVLQKKFKNKSLSSQAMAELEKLMTDDPTANQACDHFSEAA